jgi:hypothetical protein
MRYDINSQLAKALGWKLVALDYWSMTRKRGYVKCKVGEQAGKWNTPTAAKWYKRLDFLGFQSVGEYWIDESRPLWAIPADDWRPLQDINQAMSLAELCHIALVPQSDNGGLRWLAVRVGVVSYTDSVSIEPKYGIEFSEKSPAKAICKASLSYLKRFNAMRLHGAVSIDD